MIISTFARIWLGFISFLLLLPILAIGLQTTASLQRFHNRSLAPWPVGKEFLADPVAYFSAGKRWLADRAYPIIGASLFEKKILFYVLATPPQRRITLGNNGFVFLNGTDDGHLDNVFEASCILAQTQSIATRLQKALANLAIFSRVKDVPIDVIVVPTPETLYGDKLPLSVPSNYRNACAERSRGGSPLAGIKAPDTMHYVYPFAQMHAARDDDAFFPKGNWHPDGLSLKIIRDSYLASLGVPGVIGEKLQRTTGPSELLLTYNIHKKLPVYRIEDQNVVSDADIGMAMQAAIFDLFPSGISNVHVFHDLAARDQETVLMLSDSYGDLAAPVFAGGFGRLIHVMTNDMRPYGFVDLLNRIAKVTPFDRVVLLFQEGGADRIIGVSEEFRLSIIKTTKN